jgi:hypothetical protein
MALCRQLRFASQLEVKASQVPKYLGAPESDEVIETKQDIKSMTSRESSRVSKDLTPILTVARAV